MPIYRKRTLKASKSKSKVSPSGRMRKSNHPYMVFLRFYQITHPNYDSRRVLRDGFTVWDKMSPNQKTLFAHKEYVQSLFKNKNQKCRFQLFPSKSGFIDLHPNKLRARFKVNKKKSKIACTTTDDTTQKDNSEVIQRSSRSTLNLRTSRKSKKNLKSKSRTKSKMSTHNIDNNFDDDVTEALDFEKLFELPENNSTNPSSITPSIRNFFNLEFLKDKFFNF